MASRPSVYRPVEAHGSVRLDSPGGRTFNLVADGNSLRIDLSGWRAAREIAPRSFRGRKRSLSNLANVLCSHELTMTLESAGKPVLRLGHKVTQSWLARLLGLEPAHIPISAVRLLFR